MSSTQIELDTNQVEEKGERGYFEDMICEKIIREYTSVHH